MIVFLGLFNGIIFGLWVTLSSVIYNKNYIHVIAVKDGTGKTRYELANFWGKLFIRILIVFSFPCLVIYTIIIIIYLIIIVVICIPLFLIWFITGKAYFTKITKYIKNIFILYSYFGMEIN